MDAYNSESESQKHQKIEILFVDEEEEEELEQELELEVDEQHSQTALNTEEEEEEEEVILWRPKPRKREEKRVPQVCLKGYVEASDDDHLPRTKSLTDDDLDELKGCLDLGFGFSYDEIPELCNTLPALELCYSMSQKFLDDHPHQQQSNGKGVASPGGGSISDTASSSGSESSSPMPTWKISSPGDHPEDVKARLKFWAQTVACTVRLCS